VNFVDLALRVWIAEFRKCLSMLRISLLLRQVPLKIVDFHGCETVSVKVMKS
jgi:hypothetical protein